MRAKLDTMLQFDTRIDQDSLRDVLLPRLRATRFRLSLGSSALYTVRSSKLENLVLTFELEFSRLLREQEQEVGCCCINWE